MKIILREKAAAHGSPWQHNRHTDGLAVQRRACFAALAVRTIDTNSAIRKPLLRLARSVSEGGVGHLWGGICFKGVPFYSFLSLRTQQGFLGRVDDGIYAHFCNVVSNDDKGHDTRLW